MKNIEDSDMHDNKNVGWARKTDINGISLKEYFDEMIENLQSKIEMQFQMNQIAIDKAEKKMDVRLESMNEFRSQLNTQAASFVNKDYMEQKFTFLTAQIADLKETRAKLEGKASASSVYAAYILAGVSLIIGLLGVLM